MIYVHVPFCASRCIYCDFYSTLMNEDTKALYVENVCKELTDRKTYLPNTQIRTIYLGGGTPSQLHIAQIAQILQCIKTHYKVNDDAEITLEANPDDVTLDFATQLAQLGVNRVSLGVQSFDDEILKMLNRRHSAQQAQVAVEQLNATGIHNVSIDLIYGLPQQSLSSFANDLKKAFSLPIKHLSSYALSIEAHTLLAQKVQAGELVVADEEVCVKEYELLMTQAKQNGFTHYEISNFALPGYESKHNSGYWDGTPYLGVGPGAHSYDGKDRRFNTPNLKAYVASNGCAAHQIEHLSESERFDELIFVSLRTSKGLSLKKVQSLYPTQWYDDLMYTAQKYIATGQLIHENETLRISPQSIMVSDDIMSDLMRGEDN